MRGIQLLNDNHWVGGEKMKKLFSIFGIILLMFTMASCSLSEKDIKEIDDMFKSFEHNSNYVLLTCFELVICDEHYNRSEIKYNEKVSNIVFLEQDGYYSYTYDEDSLYVEFLYTTYKNFETILLGTTNVPEKIINAFWDNNVYCFRMDDPETEEFKQIYYCWDIKDKKTYILDTNDEVEYSEDNNRNHDYLLKHNSKIFNDTFEITNKETNVKKIIDISILDSFDEGKKIKKANKKFNVTFDPSQVYIIENDFYFVIGFCPGLFGGKDYHYIFKWNYETEECSYISTINFEYYQEWADD